MKKGRIIVISGPSGVGKTTLLKRLLKTHDTISFSISHTSRNKRDEEKHGIDYIFVSKEEFHTGIKDDIFLEYAEVHNNYYGTSRDQVNKVIDSGIDCLLDIDVQGGVNLMDQNVDALYIFIAPPDVETLKKRLLKRCSETSCEIETRLNNAVHELTFKDRYKYIVINDELDQAYERLETIYLKHRGGELV